MLITSTQSLVLFCANAKCRWCHPLQARHKRHFAETGCCALCMAPVVEECCSRVWCQASGARVVGGRLVCSGLIANFLSGTRSYRLYKARSCSVLILIIIAFHVLSCPFIIQLAHLLRQHRGVVAPCLCSAKEKKREMKQKLTQSLVMTINECKGWVRNFCDGLLA